MPPVSDSSVGMSTLCVAEGKWKAPTPDAVGVQVCKEQGKLLK